MEVFEELILLVGLRVPVDVRDSRAEDVALKDAWELCVVDAEGLALKDGSELTDGSAEDVELNEVRAEREEERLARLVMEPPEVPLTVVVALAVCVGGLVRETELVVVPDFVDIPELDTVFELVPETVSATDAEGLSVPRDEGVSRAVAEGESVGRALPVGSEDGLMSADRVDVWEGFMVPVARADCVALLDSFADDVADTVTFAVAVPMLDNVEVREDVAVSVGVLVEEVV